MKTNFQSVSYCCPICSMGLKARGPYGMLCVCVCLSVSDVKVEPLYSCAFSPDTEFYSLSGLNHLCLTTTGTVVTGVAVNRNVV